MSTSLTIAIDRIAELEHVLAAVQHDANVALAKHREVLAEMHRQLDDVAVTTEHRTAERLARALGYPDAHGTLCGLNAMLDEVTALKKSSEALQDVRDALQRHIDNAKTNIAYAREHASNVAYARLNGGK
jgi:hypothetical protein